MHWDHWRYYRSPRPALARCVVVGVKVRYLVVIFKSVPSLVSISSPPGTIWHEMSRLVSFVLDVAYGISDLDSKLSIQDRPCFLAMHLCSFAPQRKNRTTKFGIFVHDAAYGISLNGAKLGFANWLLLCSTHLCTCAPQRKNRTPRPEEGTGLSLAFLSSVWPWIFAPWREIRKPTRLVLWPAARKPSEQRQPAGPAGHHQPGSSRSSHRHRETAPAPRASTGQYICRPLPG